MRLAAPFADAQRAMRLIRAQAGQLRINPAKIGLMGFSAGAHLAGMTATMPDAAWYRPVDAIDALSAKAALAALLYPIVTLQTPFDTTRSAQVILGPDRTPEQAAYWSVETHVSSATPPIFLAQSKDDPISPVDESKILFRACKAAGVKSELHLFLTGGHGWGLGDPDSPVSAWPQMFTSFARQQGFLLA